MYQVQKLKKDLKSYNNVINDGTYSKLVTKLLIETTQTFKSILKKRNMLQNYVLIAMIPCKETFYGLFLGSVLQLHCTYPHVGNFCK